MNSIFSRALFILAGFITPVWLICADALSSPCTDLTCAKQEDRWFKARFNPGLPLYLTAENTKALLADMRDDQDQQLLVDTIARMSDAGKTLPAAAHPVTCAVVGNSGNLLGSHYGPLIDHHSYVFRMNNAPIHPYEQDVGTHTTHHVLHTRIPALAVYEPDTITIYAYDAWGTQYHSISDEEAYRTTLSREFSWLGEHVKGGSFPPALSGKTYLLHPAFLSYINQRWFAPEDYRKQNYPSIGFKTLILAFHLCDSVDVFGFGANTTKHSWDHYFDAGESLSHFPQKHRAEYQDEFLKNLEKRGIVRVYPGNTSDHPPYGLLSKP